MTNKSHNFNFLTRYYSDLQFRLSLYNKAKKEMDTYISSDFNVFDYIQPNENKLSDIFADLLNPDGKHGQKDTFLKEFIKMLGIVDFEYEFIKCKITREDSTVYIKNSKRRIDITLNFENRYEIGIENKPWDFEQENQLQDYNEHLSRKYNDNYCIAFLSGYGATPDSIDDELRKKLISEGKFRMLTYRNELICWLHECYKECKSEKIRIFLNDLKSYIENNFENLYVEDDGGEE